MKFQADRHGSRRKPTIVASDNRTIGRRWVAWAGVLALLLQVFLPLGQAWSMSAQDAGSGDTVLICTHWGLQAVPVDNGAGDPPGRADHSSCPACHLHSPILVSPETAALPALTAGSTIGWIPESVFRPTGRHPAGTPPRGPPANA